MYCIVFSFSLGLVVILMSSLPMIVNAADWEVRQAEALNRQQAGIGGRQGLGLTGTDRYLRDRTLNRYQDNVARYYGQYGSYYGTYGYPNTTYDSYYGNYNYNYPSYSSYSNYPIYPNTYVYPGYRASYNPGMYNRNTTFVNPPSSLNSPYGPVYSQTYINR